EGRIRGALQQRVRTEAGAGADRGPAARGSGSAEAGASRVRDAADPRRAEAVRGDRDQRDGSAPAVARGEVAGNAGADAETTAPAQALRAGRAEPALAVGHLQLSLASPRAALSGGLPRR